MDTWVLFESGEADYLQRVRNQRVSPERRHTHARQPGASLRERLARALVSLATRLAPTANNTVAAAPSTVGSARG